MTLQHTLTKLQREIEKMFSLMMTVVLVAQTNETPSLPIGRALSMAHQQQADTWDDLSVSEKYLAAERIRYGATSTTYKRLCRRHILVARGYIGGYRWQGQIAACQYDVDPSQWDSICNRYVDHGGYYTPTLAGFERFLSDHSN